jgi:hypothetical protein
VAWFASEQALRGDLDGWLNDHTESVGDCMEWQFGMANGGSIPSMVLPRPLPIPPGHRMGRVAVAKAVWEEVNKRTVPAGMCVYRRCQNPRCIAPGHLRLGKQADIGRARRINKTARRTQLDRMRIAHSRRASSVIDMDIARQIRQHMGNTPYGQREAAYQELASRHGISAKSIKNIALGRTWKETQLGSPFAGLFSGLMSKAAA